MAARIYQEPKNAMQSGKSRMNAWMLEYISSDRKIADPLTGWAGSSDTMQQLKLKFNNLDAAKAYCESRGIEYKVIATPPRTLKIQSYSDNFG